MPLTKKQKTIIGATVGAVVLAAALGITIYFVTKPSSGDGPTPAQNQFTCVDDGQGSTMLLQNTVPCAKYESKVLCQSAATSGTVQCNCPTGNVTQGGSGPCVPICLDVATWTNNTCTCPSNTQFDSNTGKCVVPSDCKPPITIDQQTGNVTGSLKINGVCTDVTQVSTLPADALATITTLCQSTACLSTSCSTGSNFSGYNAATHTCVIPNKCNGLPYYYVWPDGSNTCPGLNYSLGSDNTCVPPSNADLAVACTFNASGCGVGLQPLHPTGESCTTGSSASQCRSIGDTTPTCPAGATVDLVRCTDVTKGVCYNSSTNTCVPGAYNCVPAAPQCPEGTKLSGTCSSGTPCADSGGNCVSALAGCRPDFESWNYDTTLNVCTNVTNSTTLQLSGATGTTNQVTVVATFPSTFTTPLITLQMRYVLAGDSGTHWSGVVSSIQYPGTGSALTLTFYPDQTVQAVPASVPLKLLVIGLVQQSDGTWTPTISSQPLTSATVTTVTLSSVPASCLPTVGFSANKALSLSKDLPSLVGSTTVAITADATQLNLNNASSTPYTGTAFSGAVIPVAKNPSGTAVSQMFVVLAWSSVPPSVTKDLVTYVVKKSTSDGSLNKSLCYSGPLTALVDTVNVNVSTTYELTAQTSASCTSQPQTTVCSNIEFSGALCTSIKIGSPSTYNFMIPDPNTSGCAPILASNLVDASYYYCSYLQNPNRNSNTKAMGLANIQVPSGDSTQCVSIVPVTSPTMTQELPGTVDGNGVPTGFCQEDCSLGFQEFSRTALCACGGNCGNVLETELPSVALSDGSILTGKEFSERMNGMSKFIQQNPKLLF